MPVQTAYASVATSFRASSLSDPERPRQFWAMRTGATCREALFESLQAGELRQGWGYDDSLDLNLLKQRVNNGEILNKEGKDAWRNRRMLTTESDGIKLGDVILVPKMPTDNRFCLVEVVGDYVYGAPLDTRRSSKILAPSVQDGRDDPELAPEDFRHILPVRLLTPQGIDKNNEHANSLSGTLTYRGRLWSLSPHAATIERLLTLHAQDSTVLLTASDRSAVLESIFEDVIKKSYEELWKGIDPQLKSAQWEQPLTDAIQQLYPFASVERKGGPRENGTDILVSFPNLFDVKNPFLIPIQVKNHAGLTNGGQALSQLRQAYTHYSNDGIVVALVLLTTAEDIHNKKDFEELGRELNTPVFLCCKQELMDIFVGGMLKKRGKGFEPTLNA